jgi:hypothetical protein
MSGEGPSPATAASLQKPRRAGRAARLACLGAALCVLPAGLLLVAGATDAGAASVTSLQSEAATLSAELIQAQLSLDAFNQQYEVAAGHVTRDGLEIVGTEHAVSADDRRVISDHRLLLHQVVATYMNAGVDGGLSDLFARNLRAVSDQGVYEQVAVGDTSSTLDELHTAEVQLKVSEAALRTQQSEDRATESRAAQLTEDAQRDAATLAAEQAQVTAQLAGAIAQQRANAAAAAAASRASTALPTSSGAPVAQQAASDTTLPPFLQCVVRVESGGNYGAVSPDGLYRGAFQFSQGTWNVAAVLAGLPGLVGEPPNLASKADQDTLAVALYDADGKQPWLDGC